MLGHIKVIGFSVGLLVILSGLSSVAFAVARHREAAENPAAPASLQSAQACVVTGAALRSIAGSY